MIIIIIIYDGNNNNINNNNNNNNNNAKRVKYADVLIHVKGVNTPKQARGKIAKKN